MLPLLIVGIGLGLLLGPAPPSAPAAPAMAVIPDEPGAVVLPGSEETIQAVVADVDGDSVRELVRLVGEAAGGIVAEAWRQEGAGWARIGEPIEVVAEGGGQAERAYDGRPVRLLVRRVEGADRVTLVRVPDFGESGDATPCCLLLHDLSATSGELVLTEVAAPGVSADSILALDLDGDGTDELLASRSLPPLAGISYPSQARVFRWAGGRFAAPTVTELPIGSGDTPFVLGDSDDQPGEEAAIASGERRRGLFRLGLGPEDSIVAEAAGVSVSGALGVPVGDGRGLAVAGLAVGLAVFTWPRGQAPRPPVAQREADASELLGVVEVDGEPQIVVRGSVPERAELVRAADLSHAGAVEPTPAAAALDGGPIAAYVGPLPGGGRDASAAVLYAGHMLPSNEDVGAFGGARPVGFAGVGPAWLAIHHAPSTAAIDRRGGRLDPPVAGGTVALVPDRLLTATEEDGGRLKPHLRGGVAMDGGDVGRDVGVTASGLTAVVRAPPGSRVHLTATDESAAGPARVVGPAGDLAVAVRPPRGSATDRYRASLTLVTPAGRTYSTVLSLQVLAGPPKVDATTHTPLGSSDVIVTGRTVSYAEIEVGGRGVLVDRLGRFEALVTLPPWPSGVDVVARDPLGQETKLVVTGVGLFDYRALPWVPMIGVLALLAGVGLYLRVPRFRAPPRPATDDAALEELDPERRD